MFSAALYARVQLFAQFRTRDRGCSAHPAFPAPSCLRDNETQTSGASRRDVAGRLTGRAGVVAALLLVGNTIQVAAYSRRREVAVMKLVGASNWFIQAPFVLEAMFAGIIGALIASAAMIAGKIFLVDGSLSALASLLTPVPWSRIYLMIPIIVAIGALISGVTGWVTLRFYIKK